MDIFKMSVAEFAVESEDNKLMQSHIWTIAYFLEAQAARYHKALERIKALPIDDPRDEAPLIANAIATKALNQGDTK